MALTIPDISSSKDKLLNLKNSLSDLTSQYSIQVNRVSTNFVNGLITEDQKNLQLSTLNTQYNSNSSTIQKDIDNTQQEYSNQVSDEYKGIKDNLNSLSTKSQSAKTSQSSLSNSFSSKLSSILSNPSTEVAATAALTVSLNSLSSKSKNISVLVDNTNILVEKANASQNSDDFNAAKTSTNNTIKSIQDSISKINLVNNKIQTYNTILTVGKVVSISLIAALEVVFASPSPSKPGAKTASDKIDTLVKTVFSLSSLLQVVIPPILNSLINDLNIQQQRIEQLNVISIENQSQNNQNIVNNNITTSNINSDSGNIGTDLSNISATLNSLSSSLSTSNSVNNSDTLGVVSDSSYNGFTFAIIETTDPNFIVGSIKAKYAIALNSNGQIALKTDPSFTLNPDVLVQQLIQDIQRIGLTS